MQWKFALLETYKQCTAARCSLLLYSERGSLTCTRFSELADVSTDRIGLFTQRNQGEQAEPPIQALGFGARHLMSGVTALDTVTPYIQTPSRHCKGESRVSVTYTRITGVSNLNNDRPCPEISEVTVSQFFLRCSFLLYLSSCQH